MTSEQQNFVDNVRKFSSKIVIQKVKFSLQTKSPEAQIIRQILKSQIFSGDKNTRGTNNRNKRTKFFNFSNKVTEHFDVVSLTL